MRRPPFRPLVTALTLAALLCWAYQTRDLYHQFLGLHPSLRLLGGTQLIIFSTDTPAAALLALALLWRSRARRESRVLALFLALLAYTMSAEALWLWAHRAHLPEAAAIALDSTLPLAATACIAAFVHFSLIFPRPLTAGDWLTSATPGSLTRFTVRLRRALSTPHAAWLFGAGVFALLVLPVQVADSLGAGFAAPALGFTRPLVIAALALGMTVGMLNLRAGARGAEPAARRRLSWIVEGFLAGTVLVLLASALKAVQMIAGGSSGPPSWYAMVVHVAFLLILAGLAVAMFFSGALDPALAIRRTAVFGLVGVSMVFVFAGVENAMQNLVAEQLGMSAHLSGLVSGGLVALTFDPLKRRFDGLVERWSGRAAEAPAHDWRKAANG